MVVAHAEGAWMTDVDGRRYLDLLAGYSALNFGHGHPALLAAAHTQLDQLTLTSARSCTTSSPTSPPRSATCAARTWCCR